MTLDKNLLFLT